MTLFISAPIPPLWRNDIIGANAKKRTPNSVKDVSNEYLANIPLIRIRKRSINTQKNTPAVVSA